MIANLPIGREKGSFPHSNGANSSEVGFFFPSVEPKATIAAAITSGRDETHGNPDVFVHKETTSPPVYIIAEIQRGSGPYIWMAEWKAGRK